MDNNEDEICAAFDAVCAEIETAAAAFSRLQREYIETRNELQNNHSSQALGGPSSPERNAELLSRMRQLQIDLMAVGAAFIENTGAKGKILKDMVGGLVSTLT